MKSDVLVYEYYVQTNENDKITIRVKFKCSLASALIKDSKFRSTSLKDEDDFIWGFLIQTRNFLFRIPSLDV